MIKNTETLINKDTFVMCETITGRHIEGYVEKKVTIYGVEYLVIRNESVRVPILNVNYFLNKNSLLIRLADLHLKKKTMREFSKYLYDFYVRQHLKNDRHNNKVSLKEYFQLSISQIKNKCINESKYLSGGVL